MIDKAVVKAQRGVRGILGALAAECVKVPGSSTVCNTKKIFTLKRPEYSFRSSTRWRWRYRRLFMGYKEHSRQLLRVPGSSTENHTNSTFALSIDVGLSEMM